MPITLNFGGATVESCTQAAKAQSLAYAGLQYKGECYGGNTLGYAKAPESDCNMACTNDASETCGGASRNSVYATGLPAAPVPPAPAPTVGAVAPCDTAAIGDFKNISPPEFSSHPNVEATTIFLDPNNTNIVYATASNYTNGGNDGKGTGATYTTGIMKSLDCGATWKKVNTGVNGPAFDQGGPLIAAIDGNTIYTRAFYGDGNIYTSTNGGVDWKPLFNASNFNPSYIVPSLFVSTLTIDPKNNQHLLVNFHNNCSPASGHTPLCFAESPDAGVTWRFFDGPPTYQQAGWGEASNIAIFDTNTWIFYGPGRGANLTQNGGATWSTLSTDINGGGFFRLGDGSVLMSGANSLYRNADGLGASWVAVPGSPPATNIISDGISLFSSASLTDNSGAPFNTAPLNNLSAWKNYRSPLIKRGAGSMAYDPVRHMLYTANLSGGFWRVVTH